MFSRPSFVFQQIKQQHNATCYGRVLRSKVFTKGCHISTDSRDTPILSDVSAACCYQVCGVIPDVFCARAKSRPMYFTRAQSRYKKQSPDNCLPGGAILNNDKRKLHWDTLHLSNTTIFAVRPVNACTKDRAEKRCKSPPTAIIEFTLQPVHSESPQYFMNRIKVKSKSK